jgi:3-isopropylmalate dehydrogenase
MNKTFQIVVLPGDGIGPEVMQEGVRMLNAVAPGRFTLEEYPVGAGAFLTTGDPLPPASFAACERADAILLGAMGLPDVRWASGREMTPQIDIRERLDLYGGLRPIKIWNPIHSPLKNSANIDMLIVRENCEGLFWSRQNVPEKGVDVVEDILHISKVGAFCLGTSLPECNYMAVGHACWCVPTS